MAKRASNPQKRLIDAALRLAAEKGWAAIGLADIAREAGVPMAEAFALFPSKASILNAFMRQIDAEVLSGAEKDAGAVALPPRDARLDLLMRRLEALAPHKRAVAGIVEALPRDPVQALAVAPQFARSMSWTLAAAGYGVDGLRGHARVKALAVVWLATLRTWFKDDDPEMAHTMAALDRNLRRMERLARLMPGRRRAKGDAGGVGEGAGQEGAGRDSHAQEGENGEEGAGAPA